MINVFTRFNVKDPNYPEYDKSGNDVLTSEWLDERIEIFSKYTVPSMRWQTAAFKWHLMFDPDTDWRITQQMPDWPEVRIHFTSDWQACVDTHVGILNVRLDNDDMLMPGALQSFLKKKNDQKVKAYYVLTEGFKLDYDSGTMQPFKWPNGCFLARSYGNPYEHAHGRGVQRSGLPVFTIPGPHWVQIIHGRNVSNV